MAERMRGGPIPRANQNGNSAPQLPPVGTGLSGHSQQPSLGSNKSVPQLGVLSFEQVRQQQQQNENGVSPLPPPGSEGALIPDTERSTLDSGSWETDTGTPPLQMPLLSVSNQRPVLPTPDGSPSQPDKIQKQQSETSQDSPKLRTDVILGELFVKGPASPTPPHDPGVDLEGSVESGEYRSSFAPNKRALERIAKVQAQKAAHHIVVRRPGRSGGVNGGGRRRVHRSSSGDSGDEGADEEDERADSDDDSATPERSQGPRVGPGRNSSKLSTPGSPYGSNTDLNQVERGRPHGRFPRSRSSSRGYGMCFLLGAFVS